MMTRMDLMTNTSVLHFLICCSALPNFTKPILLEVAIALYSFHALGRKGAPSPWWSVTGISLPTSLVRMFKQVHMMAKLRWCYSMYTAVRSRRIELTVVDYLENSIYSFCIAKNNRFVFKFVSTVYHRVLHSGLHKELELLLHFFLSCIVFSFKIVEWEISR